MASSMSAHCKGSCLVCLSEDLHPRSSQFLVLAGKMTVLSFLCERKESLLKGPIRWWKECGFESELCHFLCGYGTSYSLSTSLTLLICKMGRKILILKGCCLDQKKYSYNVWCARFHSANSYCSANGLANSYCYWSCWICCRLEEHPKVCTLDLPHFWFYSWIWTGDEARCRVAQWPFTEDSDSFASLCKHIQLSSYPALNRLMEFGSASARQVFCWREHRDK